VEQPSDGASITPEVARAEELVDELTQTVGMGADGPVEVSSGEPRLHARRRRKSGPRLEVSTRGSKTDLLRSLLVTRLLWRSCRGPRKTCCFDP
jgi:hypothetical protein